MAETRTPLLDLVYNDETGRYIAVLERKIARYQLNDIKFRALLECLTGEDWDDYQFTDEDNQIKKIAVDALKRRLGLSEDDARKLVAERWAANNPAPTDESTRTYLIGETPTPHVVTTARPATPDGQEVEPAPPRYDVKKHLAGVAKAKANRQALSGANRHEVR